MSIMWNGSRIPWTAPNGDPYAGAKAYFFDVGTTTPQITYTDPSLNIPHDHPVVANSAGVFPAIFLVEASSYRERILTSADVTLSDIDGISVPTATPVEFPEGDTAAEYLYQTGDIKFAWRSAAPTGYVRCNARTIGSATSGATERANADCEDLFNFLWTQDANLAVSGGRGGTSTGDWAANKTIALPDFRGRVPAGMDSMGGTAANRITDAVLGADSDALGSVGGAQTHTLTEAELAAHDHGGVTGAEGAHKHFGVADATGSPALSATNQIAKREPTGSNEAYMLTGTTTAATLGLTSGGTSHTHSVSSAGDGDPHNNLQPTVIVPFFIKL